MIQQFQKTLAPDKKLTALYDRMNVIFLSYAKIIGCSRWNVPGNEYYLKKKTLAAASCQTAEHMSKEYIQTVKVNYTTNAHWYRKSSHKKFSRQSWIAAYGWTLKIQL